MPGIKLSTLIRRLRRDTAPGDGCSDADLLARFVRARDDAAFELLVWRHGGMVLGACQRALGNSEDAEDAFQAAFLVLARKAIGIGCGITLPAWLHRVAMRIAGRLAQRRRCGVPLDAETEAPVVPDPVEKSESLSILDQEINRLPERHRRAVVLCYLEGLTAADASRLLGCPTGTVESRLATARKTLRDRLTRRGFTLPAGVWAVLAGHAILAPEAVARVVQASVIFLRDGAAIATGIVGKPSVKLAQEVLTMWRVRMQAGLLALALAASAGVVLADRELTAIVADEPVSEPIVAIAPPPAAKAETPTSLPATAVTWPLAQKFYWNGAIKGVSPDGRSLIYHSGSSVSLLNLTSMNESSEFHAANVILDVAFSPDGKFVATAEGTNGVKLRDAATGNILDALWPSGGIPPHRVVFTPDGKKLIALCLQTEFTNGPGPFGGFPKGPPNPKKEVQKTTLSYQVSIWDLATRKEVGQAVESVSSIPGIRPPELEFAAGGRFLLKTELVIKEIDGKREHDGFRISVIDPLTGAAGTPAEFRVPGFTPGDASMAVSPDGKAMIGVSPHELLVFDTTTGQERLRLGRLPQTVQAVTFSPDGKWIAAASGTGQRSAFGPAGFRGRNAAEDNLTGPTEVVIWDATTGKEAARLGDKETNRDYRSIQFSPDGLYVMAQDGGSNATTIWGRPPHAVSAKPTPVPKDLPRPEVPAGVPDRFQALIRDLQTNEIADSRRVEVIFLAALGRLPTNVEGRTLAAQIARQTDKPAALNDLLAILIATDEFQAHATALQQLAKPPWPSVSPENPTPSNPGSGGKGPIGKKGGKG